MSISINMKFYVNQAVIQRANLKQIGCMVLIITPGTLDGGSRGVVRPLEHIKGSSATVTVSGILRATHYLKQKHI